MTETSRNQPEAVQQELRAFFDAEWERTLSEFPIMASELGDKRHNRRWPDLEPEALERQDASDRKALDWLNTVETQSLSESDQLSVELMKKKLATAVEERKYCWHFLPLTARSGIQDANSLADALLFESPRDYEDWIHRLNSFQEYMDGTIALMRDGIRNQMVHPRCVMQRVPAQIERQIVSVPQDSPFFKPFCSFSSVIPEQERSRLTNLAGTAIRDVVVPAFQRLQQFFSNEYLPACPQKIGISQFQHGEEMYGFFARKFTTTNYRPSEIHQIGRDEVARIRAEMESVISDLKFQGSFPEFLDFLRNDRRFYFENANDLMTAYKDFCQGVDVVLPKFFHRLPKTWYDIQPIPMNIAPDTTTAYYRPLSADGKRAGTYFVNLYKPEVRPKYEIAALSLHEAVPGHHLQIALAAEQKDLPAFRKYAPEGEYTGYVEGWALYAESLGYELGCYEDLYSKFGQLTYDMWRAVRLVVDTGIHVFHWSRDQAVEYFLQNTAKTRHDIENEVDRYIAWPGQALAYKIGEIRIRELRRCSEKKLGSNFSLPDFHDAILDSGPIPLDLLETVIERRAPR